MIRQTIPLSRILSNTEDGPIDLADPLVIDIIRDEDKNGFILSNEEYHLLGVADTLQDAMQEIEHGILFLCSEYLREDDDNLTKGGRELKSRLHTLFPCGDK